MTTNEVKGLPAKWRGRAVHSPNNLDVGPTRAQQYKECADELESALASAPAGEAVAVVVENVVGVEIVWANPPSAGRPPVGTKLYTHPTPAADASEGEVPRGVWEALQRMIEDGWLRGPASAEDAQLVAKWRDRLATSAQPGDAGMAGWKVREFPDGRVMFNGPPKVGGGWIYSPMPDSTFTADQILIDLGRAMLASAPPQPERPASGEREVCGAPKDGRACYPECECDTERDCQYGAAPVQADGREVGCAHCEPAYVGGFCGGSWRCRQCGGPVEPVGIRAATPEEEAAVDADAGLAKLTIRLPIDLLQVVDEAAEREGLVRQAMLRDLIKRGLFTENIALAQQAHGGREVGK